MIIVKSTSEQALYFYSDSHFPELYLLLKISTFTKYPVLLKISSYTQINQFFNQGSILLTHPRKKMLKTLLQPYSRIAINATFNKGDRDGSKSEQIASSVKMTVCGISEKIRILRDGELINVNLIPF